MPDPRRLDEAREWLRYAAEDLEVTYPVTHGLNVLLDLCADIDSTLISTVGPALWLTQFAVRFRYPGEEEEPGLEKAQEGVNAARTVHSSVCKRLLQGGSRFENCGHSLSQ